MILLSVTTAAFAEENKEIENGDTGKYNSNKLS